MPNHACASGSALVLGGGGFIGSALRKKLAAYDKAVTILSRSAPETSLSPNENWVTGDLADTALLSNILTQDQDIYHLVSSSIPANGNWDVANDIHQSVLPTLDLLKLAVTQKARRVIFVSSGGTVYGPAAQVPTPEDSPTTPITSYGVSKLTIENYLRIFAHHHGLSYRVARVANPFGPGQRPLRQQGVIANLMHQALNGHPFQIWGDGSVARDFIHVDDVADALVALANYEGEECIFNVGSGQARTIKSIADDIDATMGLSDHPVIHHAPRPFDVPVSYLDISRIRQETGWSPQSPWRESLKQTLDWLRSVMPVTNTEDPVL